MPTFYDDPMTELRLMRLKQYDALFIKLRKYDWFEFTSGGGIIAHEKNEPESFGHGFVVPEEMITITYKWS